MCGNDGAGNRDEMCDARYSSVSDVLESRFRAHAQECMHAFFQQFEKAKRVQRNKIRHIARCHVCASALNNVYERRPKCCRNVLPGKKQRQPLVITRGCLSKGS